jgi:uncharacterized membrane protein
MSLPASLGAPRAFAPVAAVGPIAPPHLPRAPEKSLKLSAGVMISAFGIFWLGEGMGLRWPGEDLAPIGLIGALGLAAAPSGRMVRRIAAQEGGGA